MNVSKSHILWVQVWVLAALQGAITLAWIIYNAYVPQLLVQFGFPASLAVGLLVLENALAVIMEPLMGGLSDQAQRWVGSRFLYCHFRSPYRCLAIAFTNSIGSLGFVYDSVSQSGDRFISQILNACRATFSI